MDGFDLKNLLTAHMLMKDDAVADLIPSSSTLAGIALGVTTV